MSSTMAGGKDSMEQTNDQWLWVIDDELVESLARHDTLDPKSARRTVQSAALVKALSAQHGRQDRAGAARNHRGPGGRRDAGGTGLDQGAPGVSTRPIRRSVAGLRESAGAASQPQSRRLQLGAVSGEDGTVSGSPAKYSERRPARPQAGGGARSGWAFACCI